MRTKFDGGQVTYHSCSSTDRLKAVNLPRAACSGDDNGLHASKRHRTSARTGTNVQCCAFFQPVLGNDVTENGGRQQRNEHVQLNGNVAHGGAEHERRCRADTLSQPHRLEGKIAVDFRLTAAAVSGFS